MRTGAMLAALAAALVVGSATPGASAGPFDALTEEGLPNVQSAAAFVLDAKTGELVYARNPDEERAIASTGKIFVAMVARRRGIDLEAVTEITRTDCDYAKGGARTRLDLGRKFRNIDLMHAMLVASDNRAPTAIGRAVGLEPDELIAEMNLLARELGLTRTRFSDPSGLNGNTSTAREMALALKAALADEVIAEILGTRLVTVRSVASRPRVIDYRNTNRTLHSDRYDVFGGKTGFTDAAGYCLLIAARVDGRELVMSFLGSREKLTRFGDFGRVAGWVESLGGAGGSADTAVAGAEP